MEGKKCMNQGHTGLVETIKARIQLLWEPQSTFCLATNQDHHLQFICPASLMSMRKYAPTLISPNEAGVREGCRPPRAVFATGKMVNKPFLYPGSPFTTWADIPLSWSITAEGLTGWWECCGWRQRGWVRGVGWGRSRRSRRGEVLAKLTAACSFLLIESIDSSYKRTDNWLLKSL